MTDMNYDPKFFVDHVTGSHISAQEVLPLILQFVQPSSVVDVGCGTGPWLAEFSAAGVSDCVGLDGDYVDRASLLIDPKCFIAHDLSKPIQLDRGFDLAISLEVAEHLPPESAEPFIASLTRLAPVVLFSAAIPFQGGKNHVNEQWPEYWQEIFSRHGYVVVDCLRGKLWKKMKVARWYRQNMMFYVDRQRIGEFPALAQAFDAAGQRPPLSFVHPEHYDVVVERLLKEITESHQQLIRAQLRLREISLIAFPNWRMHPRQSAEQLRAIIKALNEHPQRSKTTLVIDQGEDHQAVNKIIQQVAGELLAPAGIATENWPLYSYIGGSISAPDWKQIVDCMAAWLELPQQDNARLAASGAARLRKVTFATVQAKQSISL